MPSNLASALVPVVFHSLYKQLYLTTIVGEHIWQFDMTSGLLSLDNRYRWQTHLLGTESNSARTWLWAWANSGSQIPDRLLTASRTLRTYGERHNIQELTQPELSLDRTDGHTLALIASSICDADAYYRCPYDGGALFVLIKDENFPKCPDPPLQRVASVFPQAIASLDIPDHKRALTGYLDHYGLGYEQVGDKVVVKENGEPVLTASFDEQSRLTSLEVTMKPQVGRSVETWDEWQVRRLLGG